LHPALDEFLRGLGEMAADEVLPKYKQTKGLGPFSIASPRGFYSKGKALRKAEDRERFAEVKGPVRIQRTGGSDGREE
jgi:hypothetical protein